MLERRAGSPPRHPARTAGIVAVPAQDDDSMAVLAVHDRQSGPPQPAAPDTQPAVALVDFARRVAGEHHAAHGHPITRDALRARLGVSNQLASDLLRQIRTTTPSSTLNGERHV
jgi:hypothetical protein